MLLTLKIDNIGGSKRTNFAVSRNTLLIDSTKNIYISEIHYINICVIDKTDICGKRIGYLWNPIDGHL